MSDRIKVNFKRVFVINDGDWIGSGEFYFDAKVDGRQVGTTDLDFDAIEQHWIDLPDGQWSAEVDVTNRDAASVQVSFHVKDRDILWDDDMGSVSVTLRPPWTQGPRRNRTENFILEWEVLLFADGTFGTHPANSVFACRNQPGGISCTTVSGTSFQVRLEFDEVRPTPPRPASQQPPWIVPPAVPQLNAAGIVAPFAPGADLNTIHNPAVIPLLTPVTATAANVAIIEYTYYWPSTMNFTDDDPRLEWTAVSISGGAAVAFFNGVNLGRKILVYGTVKGEVRLEVRYKGALLATYRALVAPIKQIQCRFTILNGPPGAQPRSTPANVQDHLSLANIWLYQVGVQLVLDTNVTTTDGARASAIPGIFRIRVPAGQTADVRVVGFIRAASLNFRPNVMNFVYIFSDHAGNLGAAVDYPASNAGGTISDNGTPSTSWISPCGIPPEGAAANQTMTLLAARIRPAPAANPNRFNGLFSMYITDADGDPSNLNAQHSYANVIAHEFGHNLNLAHRVDTPASPYNDGLNYPPNENVMHWVNPWAQAQDFDIIQAKAVQQSPLLPP